MGFFLYLNIQTLIHGLSCFISPSLSSPLMALHEKLGTRKLIREYSITFYVSTLVYNPSTKKYPNMECPGLES